MPHVLVVEDDVDLLSSVVEAIREEGFRTCSAANGYQALDEVERHRDIDLILLDLVLPFMDGRRFLGELKARFPERRIPVVVLTGRPDLVEDSLGAAEVLSKPFHLEDLVGLVRARLGSSGSGGGPRA